MLIGTTFAWFTDSVTSTGNKIQSGTLSLDLLVYDKTAGDYVSIKNTEDAIFNYEKWEPGYTEVKLLQVKNLGTLALKWVAQFVSEKQLSALADVIDVYVKPSATALAMPTERDVLDTYTKVGTVAEFVNTIETTTKGELLEGESAYLGIALKMQETAGNEYQGLDLGGEFDIRIFATQLTAESDSFDEQYDKEAPNATYEVTPANIQAYLDGEYADLENATLLLTAGDYGTLYLGRPTKHAGSNTVYICNTHGYETDSAEEFATHLGDGTYHTTPLYETTVRNLTLKAEDGVTVDGVLVTSGHTVGPATDYVLDKTITAGSLYYSTLRINGLTFDGITFDGRVNIETSDAKTVYDGVSFVDCTFDIGDTVSSNKQGIRYYNEANNGNVKNLTVDNCTFKNCYQGVYTANTNGITVVNSEFDTTGHNAIAIQSTVHGAVDLESVVIENNVFKNINDRIIRFGEIGADSDISVQYNYARNSGDEDKEVIKAVSIDSGAEFDVKFNDWGAGTVIANSEFSDTDTVALVGTATEFKTAAESGKDVYVVEDIEVVERIEAKGGVIDGNGKTITMSDAFNKNDTVIYADAGAVTVKNLTFDGIDRVAAIRTLNAELTVDNCTFANCTQSMTQGIIRCNLGNATITNCRFTDNTCTMVISFNYDASNDTTIMVENCLFENNTCAETAVVYTITDVGTTIKGNSFINNTVNISGNNNGATVYVGFTENVVVRDNLFSGNTVKALESSRERLSGGLMLGYKAVVTNNVFINNSVENKFGTSDLGRSVTASAYYGDIDLSGNYWDGGVPVYGVDYYNEYDYVGNSVIVDNPLTTYTIDDDGVGVKA